MALLAKESRFWEDGKMKQLLHSAALSQNKVLFSPKPSWIRKKEQHLAVIGKLREIYVVANIFLEIIILQFMQQRFQFFQVTCLLFPSSSASTFPSFCHLASRMKALKRSFASSVTLPQAHGSSLSFWCGFLRKEVSLCIFLSLLHLFPCGFSRVLWWLSSRYGLRKINCKCSLPIRNWAFKKIFQRLLYSLRFQP